MMKMPDTLLRYFSVKHSTKIQGVRYVPSVCYPLPSGLQPVIEEMAAHDMARIYPEKVRFVTGVPYPVKKPETGAAALPFSSATAREAKAGSTVQSAAPRLSTAGEKPGRKSGRSGYVVKTDREFD
jgi:hypothetical protein